MKRLETREFNFQIDPFDGQIYLFPDGPGVPEGCGRCLVTVLCEESQPADQNNKFDSKDIYLQKDDEIIGLHSIGYAEEYNYTQTEPDGTVSHKKSDFNPIESYGNEYDVFFRIKGRGSFRLTSPFIEDVAQEYVANGWKLLDKPESDLPPKDFEIVERINSLTGKLLRPRANEMTRMWKSGKSAEEIASHFNVTRERVRQCIWKTYRSSKIKDQT